VKLVYQVEVSGICNLKCPYCPYPYSKRKKGFMSKKTFIKSLELIKKLKQNYVCLHNFGEPLLHPKILDFIKIARKHVENVVLSTNGVLMTRELAIKLKKAGLTELYLSTHNYKTALRAMWALRGLGLLKQLRFLFGMDWAGTAKNNRLIKKIYDRFPKKEKCCFLEKNWVVILWDGRINSCCIDMEGQGVVGSVYDKNAMELSPKPTILCKKCHKPNFKDKKYYFK